MHNSSALRWCMHLRWWYFDIFILVCQYQVFEELRELTGEVKIQRRVGEYNLVTPASHWWGCCLKCTITSDNWPYSPQVRNYRKVNFNLYQVFEQGYGLRFSAKFLMSSCICSWPCGATTLSSTRDDWDRTSRCSVLPACSICNTMSVNVSLKKIHKV